MPISEVTATQLSDQRSDNPEYINKAQSYLQNLETLRAHFIQSTPKGRKLSGVFFLKRPGKLRFEYEGLEDFVVADGTFIYFYDSEIKSQSHAPIHQTPAHFLLRENLKFSGDISVRDSFFDGQNFIVTLFETKDPGAGTITLVFDVNDDQKSLTLKQWIVKDSQDNLTKVTLSDIEKNIDLDPDLFVYRDPESSRPVYNE